MVKAVNFDPEDLYKGMATSEGIINRRLARKELEKNKELAAQVSTVKSESQVLAIVRRESRPLPPANVDAFELVEYLLDTPSEDIEFEVARCRPLLDKPFFLALDGMIGAERFAAKPDEDRLAELDTLRQYLDTVTKVVDKVIAKTTSAVDRMKKLLMSKDKQATILEMAGNNEIDPALIELLRSNASAARTAGQEDAAKFMDKVLVAAQKFMVMPAAPSSAEEAAPVAKAPGKAAAPPEGPSKLILL